jgi:hypothetical protein
MARHVHYAGSRASVRPATCPSSPRFTDARDLFLNLEKFDVPTLILHGRTTRSLRRSRP